MALENLLPAIKLIGLAVLLKNTRICAKTHRPAKICDVFLLGHQVNDRMCRVRRKLRAVGIRISDHMPCKFDHRHLHAKADAKVRNPVLARILRRQDHAFGSAVSKASRYDHAVNTGEQLLAPFPLQLFRIHPADRNLCAVLDSAVVQGLHHRQIRIMKLRVFADQCDLHLLIRMLQAIHHILPFRKVRLRAGKMQTVADRLGQMLVLHHQWNLINAVRIQILKNMAARDIAEQRNLILQILRHLHLGAADNHVRTNSHLLKRLHAHLRRLRLHLGRAVQIRNQRHMNHAGVAISLLLLELTDGFKERLGLNVADRSADLNDGNRHILRPDFRIRSLFLLRLFRRIGLLCIESGLNLVGDMRNHLNGSSAVISVAFLIDHGPVHLSGGDVGIVIQVLVDKTLIVSQVQIRFRSVVRYKHLSVLNRIHRAGIHIQIRIKLLHGDMIASCLQKSSERSRCNSFSKSGNNASADKYILNHILLLHWFLTGHPRRERSAALSLPAG